MQAALNSAQSSKRQKKAFTVEEDQLINFIVKSLGSKHWDMIATFVKGRTAKQCRDRYMNYLKPGLTNIEWTQQEDNLLLELYIKFGPKWATINKYFYNRNQISLKNRFRFLQKSLNVDEKISSNHSKFDPTNKKQKASVLQQGDLLKDDMQNITKIGLKNGNLNEIVDVKNEESIFNLDCDFDFDENLSSFSFFTEGGSFFL